MFNSNLGFQATLNVKGANLYLINVFAPSGKKKENERESLFQTELIHQLILICYEVVKLTLDK